MRLIGSPVGDRVAVELPDRERWLAPTIVQLELAKWLGREAGEDKADQVNAFTKTCLISDLDTPIAAPSSMPRHRLMAPNPLPATGISTG